MKTSALARQRNRAARSDMKSIVKELKACKSRAEAEKIFRDAASTIDRAAGKNLIHKNKAARDKSKLAAFVASLPSS
jgi:small subunit ribosomal protein S20